MNKTFFLLLLICASSFAQKNINNYKYIIVPEKFDFFKTPDKYQTSSLTKFLFEKKGFKVLLKNESLPEDVFKNRCLALDVIVTNNSTMFVTKNTIELRNCKNDLVFKSLEGTSKQKEFKKSYHEAIRKAFVSVKSLNYNYQPIQELIENRIEPKEVVTINTTATQVNRPRRTEGSRGDNPFNSDRTPILYAKPTNKGFQLLNVKKEVADEKDEISFVKG